MRRWLEPLAWAIIGVGLIAVGCQMTACAEPGEPEEVDSLEMTHNLRCIRKDGKVLYIHKGQMAKGYPKTHRIVFTDKVTGKRVEMIDDGRWKCVPAAQMPGSL